MPYTVWGAFKEFREKTVDLDPGTTKVARSSRDYLINQLKAIEKEDWNLPRLIGSYIPYGSFARSTKIKPLDDIDLLIPLVGTGTTAYQSTIDIYEYWLRISDSSAPLAIFPDEFNYVNSTKILNKIKDSLSEVQKYYKADVHKSGEAVTLELLSYDWVYDIVPAVPIRDGQSGTAYYLIPDGSGDWKRTNPRVDATNVTRVNGWHNGNFLPAVRLLKYWNGRPIAPKLASYYFETLALKVFDSASKISDFPIGVNYFFKYCSLYLWSSCPDPKGLGPPLDDGIDNTTKKKVAEALDEAGKYSDYALMYERSSEHDKAIYWWQRIFGDKFPKYG
jgi:hypothetical protein